MQRAATRLLRARCRTLFGARWPNVLPLVRPWGEARRSALATFWQDTLTPLRQAFPSLRFTASVQGLAGREVRRIDPAPLDLIEAHIWISEHAAFALASGQLMAMAGLPGALPLHRRLGPFVYRSAHRRWIRSLEDRMEGWRAWAARRLLPIHTSEGFGPVFYDAPAGDGDAAWRWVRRIGAEGVRIAIERGWSGVCTSNFCQPHFPGMWRPVAWHRELTGAIRRRH